MVCRRAPNLIPSRSGSALPGHRIAPSPPPGGAVVAFGASRYPCDDEPLGRIELRRHFDLVDIRLRQHPRWTSRDRRARQRDIAEFFVLEWKLRSLDLLMRARARQALREMTPVRRRQRARAVLRAGGRN